jgi:hypothetical protein
MLADFTISDWLSNTDLVQLGLWVVYGFIVLASAVLGGFATGFVSQKVALVFVGELSRKVVMRIRLGGAALAGGLAVLMLNPGYIGIGSGPGRGGQPGTGTSKEVVKDTSTSLSDKPAKTDPGGLTERPGGKTVLRIMVLGDGTQPPYQPVDRYFAFADDPNPQALDVDAVMKRIEQLKKDGSVKEVELVLTQRSASLQNLQVQRLRRAIQQADLRLYVPPDADK